MSALTGKCHCGYVRYQISADKIKKSSYCGCEGCRRATGALKIPFVTVGSSDFELTGGELTKYKSPVEKDCDLHGTWNYCNKCGGPVAWISNDGKQTDILAGTLDDVSAFKPDQE